MIFLIQHEIRHELLSQNLRNLSCKSSFLPKETKSITYFIDSKLIVREYYNGLYHDFPYSKRYNVILVIVDWLNKLLRFVCTKDSVMTFDTSKFFLYSWWHSHGLPRSIILDRDFKFTNVFWKYLFLKLGMKLMFNTTFYPQIDR